MPKSAPVEVPVEAAEDAAEGSQDGKPEASEEELAAEIEAGSDDSEALQEANTRIELLEQQLSDAKDLARRAQADLENVRRRAKTQQKEFRSRAVEDICNNLLPVLDDLERAVAGTEATATGEDGAASEATAPALDALRKGVHLVHKRFVDTLGRQGLVEIEAEGAIFDPRLHNAVQRVPAAKGQADEEVVQVFQRGYLLDGRVVRPATVVVAAGAPPEEEADEADAEASAAKANGKAVEESDEPEASTAD